MKKFILSLCLIGISFLGFATYIPGPYTITDQETWTLANSPYHVLGKVIIDEDYPNNTTVCDAELIIQAGVVVYFYEYHVVGGVLESSIEVVDGKLTAVGAPGSMITLTKVSGGGYENWSGINFNGTTGDQLSQIKYCTIEYSEKDPGGCGSGSVTLDGGAIFIKDFDYVEIENCTIRNCSISGSRGGAIFMGSSGSFSSSAPANYPLISNNNIYDCEANAGGAIAVFGSYVTPTITMNNINGNIANIGGGGIGLLNLSTAIISKNTINSNQAKCIGGNGSISVKGGGGILVTSGSSAIIENNTISENSVADDDPNQQSTYPGSGGGILVCIDSEIEIEGNKIHGNSSANYGGGIAVFGEDGYNMSGFSTYAITGNEIMSNESTNGAGMHFQDSYGEASENKIYENIASSQGGAICFQNATGSFDWNTITSNSAGQGSAVYFYNNIYLFGQFNLNLVFSHNTIAYNSVGEAGTFYAKSDNVSALYRIELINNLIHSNTSEELAAGVYFHNYLNTILINNTVASNTSETTQGNAIYVADGNYSACVYAENNILYYNGDQGDCQIYNPKWDPYSDYQNNCIQDLGCQIDPGTNNDLIPDFVDLNNDDYRLNPTSPLIEMGNSNASPMAQVDLDNAPRIQGVVDIGAYEQEGDHQDGDDKRMARVELSITDVYPNPASDYLVVATNTANHIQQLTMYSIDGKLVYSQTGIFELGEHAIDLSELSEGIYTLKIRTVSGVESHKIVKK